MASSGGEMARLVDAIAAGLAVVGVAIVASGVAGYAPEAVPSGAFALVWAMVCGIIAGRLTGRWFPDALPFGLKLRDVLGTIFSSAGVLALGLAFTVRSVEAPRAIVLLPLGLAGLSWLLTRSLSSISPVELPDAPGLARWARVGTWQGLLSGSSMLGRWWIPSAPWAPIVSWIGGLTLIAVAIEVFRSSVATAADGVGNPSPLADLKVIHALGSRLNPLAGILDATEGFLGVDLRGSWALRVVRRGAEPIAIVALFVGWLATSLTQVRVYEQGVIEHLGRIVPGETLGPGLHVHLPWPIERVRREPVGRVLSIAVGHEGAEPEDAGPENVLWARQHESNEFMFLLGDGRDLVTIDGLMRYRIRDLRRYLTQSADSPALLRGLVNAAVTHRTVDRSLDQVLSENLAAFARDIAAAVQADADALGLGVEVVDMTIGGMHPPVVVAAEYEAVVSAQVLRDTLVVGARTESERDLPAAETAALTQASTARAEAATTLAAAKGESAAFRGVRASLAAEPDLFHFRRRLQALETGLAGRRTVIVDDRLERDGATLWLTE